jgi:hypothetical protein
MTFSDNLVYGQTGETIIARWLRHRGCTVLPVYEKIFDTGKGPQLFLPDDKSLVAPDMLVYKGKDAYWIEAKHKTAFSWHRITGRWVTGIDLRHYEDYCQVDDVSPWPVWLLFLHDGGQAKDSPPNSPSGLFGNTLSKLRRCENHRHGNWGTSGMVYWAIDNLIFIADEITELSKTK